MSIREYEFTSSGLVNELAELMMTGVPTHPDWAEGLAAAIIGMIAGKERFISNDYGKLYGNIFLIYIGASGLSFKTVPLKKVVRPLLKELTDRTNHEVCLSFNMRLDEYTERRRRYNRMSEREKKTPNGRAEKLILDQVKQSLVDFMSLQRFTSEKLTSWLNEFPQGMIAGDEYTKMFKGAKTKDYLTDNMEDLSRLYDCDVEKVGTQVRGVEYPENAYVAFCSATTYYLLTLMSDDFFIQGTGNRPLWILDDTRKKVDVDVEALKGEFFWGIEEDRDFNQRMSNLAERLMLVRRLPEGLIPLSLEASIALDKYRLQKYNDAVDKFSVDLLDKDANLIARLAQNAMKLALVHCIGRYAFDYDKDDPPMNMEINIHDANWAIEKMEKHFDHYSRMRFVASRVRGTTTRSYSSDQERVVYTIKRLEGEGKKITKTIIMQATGWLKDDCQAILDAMLATKQIEMYHEVSGTRKVTYYTVPKPLPTNV